MESKPKLKVKLTKSGIYRVVPFKAEYARYGEYETMKILFFVDFGMQIACMAHKTIFFKSKEQVNEEIRYILKFICPDCLDTKYDVKTFEQYAQALCVDINKELQRQRENKERTVLFGKLKKRKDSKYVEFEELLPKSGDFRVDYLATPDNVTSLYFSAWEAQNCDMPFEIEGNASAVLEPAEEAVYDVQGSDLPF